MPHPTTFAMREDAGPAATSGDVRPSPALAVLVPTRNEAPNIEELLRRVSAAVTGITSEIVFVDDSDDDTPDVIRTLAGRHGGGCQVSLIHRQGAQRIGGLGGAVVDGLRALSAPWVCVLDADLQHPPEVIPDLLAAAVRDGADLVVASRYCGQGRADGLGPVRGLISTACGSTARLLFPLRLRGVTDPMSGFFLLRRSAVDPDTLRPRGFKILLELLVRSGGLRTTEVGYAFAGRFAGESKGSLREGLTYAVSLGVLRLGREGTGRVGA